MLYQHFLILRSTIFAHFFTQHLLKISEELVLKPSGSVALLAGSTVLIDFGSITFEAFWKIFTVLGPFLLRMI